VVVADEGMAKPFGLEPVPEGMICCWAVVALDSEWSVISMTSPGILCRSKIKELGHEDVASDSDPNSTYRFESVL